MKLGGGAGLVELGGDRLDNTAGDRLFRGDRDRTLEGRGWLELCDLDFGDRRDCQEVSDRDFNLRD